MIIAWIVVAKDKHIDDQYSVFVSREDALQEASAIAQGWAEEYEAEEDELDTELCGGAIFSCSFRRRVLEDAWSVQVFPQIIWGEGESGDI